MNIKEKLLTLEEEFHLYKSNFEKKYVFFIILYFSPPALAALFLSKFNRELYENMVSKTIIFGLIVIGLVVHYVLKYTFYRTNKNYKEFIQLKFDIMKKWFPDDETFKNSVIEAAKEIFKDKNQELSKIIIKKKTEGAKMRKNRRRRIERKEKERKKKRKEKKQKVKQK